MKISTAAAFALGTAAAVGILWAATRRSTRSEDANRGGDLAALDEDIGAAGDASPPAEKGEENAPTLTCRQGPDIATASTTPPAAAELAESNAPPVGRDLAPSDCGSEGSASNSGTKRADKDSAANDPTEKAGPGETASEFVEVVYDEEHLKAIAEEDRYLSHAASFNVYPQKGLDYFI